MIGAKIYQHVYYQGKYHAGVNAAEILIHNQLEGIKTLSGNGVLVKVNSVMIKDINDGHIPEVIKKLKSLGAHMANIMPLIPARGSAFQSLPRTGMKELNALRELCRMDMPQMRHCQQCRADAIGLLMEDQSYKFRNTGTEAIKKYGNREKKAI